MPSVSWNIKAWVWEWLGISDKFEANGRWIKEAFDKNRESTTKSVNEYLSTLLNANEANMLDNFAGAALSSGKTPKEAYDLAEQMLDERDIRRRKRAQ